MTKFLEKIVKPAWSLLAKICANLLDFLKNFISSQELLEQADKKTPTFPGKSGEKGTDLFVGFIENKQLIHSFGKLRDRIKKVKQ
jgi:hypothetical protein